MLQPESFTETAYDLSNPAGGDLLTARTRDEVGELIRSFNSKVAQLKARMVMKQAMNLAMEVQQNLLPKKVPQIKGLDIAARSIYCDETGGLWETQDQAGAMFGKDRLEAIIHDGAQASADRIVLQK
jgi:hypothetical protein